MRVGVAVLIESPQKEPGKILLVEEATSDEEIQKQAGAMTIVTGHAKSNETLEQSAKREVMEESGIKNVVLTGVLGVYQINGAIGVVFLGTTDEDIDLKAINSEEISSAGWYDPKEVATGAYTLRPPLKHVLEDYMAGKKHPLDLVRYSLEA